MKAIGKNLVILKKKEGATKTKGGLLLAETHKDDIRYHKAVIVSAGTEVAGVSEGDVIYYDKHAGHQIEFEKEIYHVIKVTDVVVVL